MKLKTMLKNNIISLFDQVFPGVNKLFSSPPRKSDGHEKWLDFSKQFWHCECVCGLSQKAFTLSYQKWCKRAGYYFRQTKSDEIYASACGHFSVMPKNESTKVLITQAITQINAISESISIISKEMSRLAAMLPEYSVVIEFFGVGEVICPQFIAEIGDVYRYSKKSSLVRFAGLEPQENSSGKFRGKEAISKQDSPHLRKTLFQIMDCLLQKSPADNPIYQFIDRKRAEGKHYYHYMTAGSAKFLRIYYARVKHFLDNLHVDT